MADEDAQALDAKLDTLDDHLEPIKEEDKSEVKPDEKPEESEESPKEQETEKEKGEETPETESEEKDEGYAIDEDEEESSEEEPSTSTEKQTPNLTAEQKFILDNLTPIKVRGEVNGKVQTFDVLTPEQLPSGFKFADDREAAQATKGFSQLEAKAEKLQNDFRTQETEKATKEFKAREDAADRADIGKLQRNGDIPKFKLQPNDPKFETDSAAEVVQKVLDYKDKTNQRYMEEYNAGRAYKHIGFEEAYYMYQRENPPEDTAQKKEDSERKEFANRTSNNRSESPDTARKPRVHSGSTSRDLDALIENLDW